MVADLELSPAEMRQIDLEAQAEALRLDRKDIAVLEQVKVTGNHLTYKARKNADMGELEVKLVELDNLKLEKDSNNRVIIPHDVDNLIDNKGYRRLVRIRIETEGVTVIRRLADRARKAKKPSHYFMKALGTINWNKITKEDMETYKLNGRRLKKLLKQAKMTLDKAEAVVWKYLSKTGNWSRLEDLIDLAGTKTDPVTYLLKCLQMDIQGKTPKFSFAENSY